MEQDQFGQTRSKWLLLIHKHTHRHTVSGLRCDARTVFPPGNGHPRGLLSLPYILVLLPPPSLFICLLDPLTHVPTAETGNCQCNDGNKGNAHAPLIPPSQKPPQLVCLNLLIHGQLINIQRAVLWRRQRLLTTANLRYFTCNYYRAS